MEKGIECIPMYRMIITIIHYEILAGQIKISQKKAIDNENLVVSMH